MPGLTPDKNNPEHTNGELVPSAPPFVVPVPTSTPQREPELQPPSLPGLYKLMTFCGVLPHERPLSPEEIQAAFPSDYFASRDRFLKLAHACRAHISSYPIKDLGPNGEVLNIDFAHIGSLKPKNLILHLAGVHGVEGFVGSAIQSEILRAVPVLAEGTALVLVHCLNPYGMAHLRRVNAHNVDINRNFLALYEEWKGTPAGYKLLNSILNPKHIDFPAAFYPKIWIAALRHGKEALKSALLRGQYDNRHGLFFGGKQHEDETIILQDYIAKNLAGAERVIGIDVHSGLGKYGGQTLFVEHRRSMARFGQLERLMSLPLTPQAEDYQAPEKRTRGAICDEVPKLFPAARVDWILQEFGTVNPFSVLAALRAENHYFQAGLPSARARAAQKLKSTFVPEDIIWRDYVLRKGTELPTRAVLALQK